MYEQVFVDLGENISTENASFTLLQEWKVASRVFNENFTYLQLLVFWHMCSPNLNAINFTWLLKISFLFSKWWWFFLTSLKCQYNIIELLPVRWQNSKYVCQICTCHNFIHNLLNSKCFCLIFEQYHYVAIAKKCCCQKTKFPIIYEYILIIVFEGSNLATFSTSLDQRSRLLLITSK